MFQVLILVCAANVSPQDCQKETALDVFRGPTVSNEIMCGLHGQAYLAETSLNGRGTGDYMKINCLRSSVASRTAPGVEIRNQQLRNRSQPGE